MDAAEHGHLLEQLLHPDEELRRLAVERTSLLSADEALPLLAERLGDASWRVRKAAVARLAALPERAPTVAALLEALADGGHPGRRNAALEALIGCGRGATAQLVSALASPDVDVRKQVVDVLGAIGDPRAEAGLGDALRDADANVRAAAAEALAAVGARSAAEQLLWTAQADAEPFVRAAALLALAHLGAPVPFAVVKEALERPLLAPAAYAALGQSDEPQALGLALRGLLARRASAREAAARAVIALAARDGGSSVGEAARAFAAQHPDVVREAVQRIEESAGEMKLAAVQFAGLLATPSAAAVLARCGTDATLAAAACEALVALGEGLPPALARGWASLSPAERSFACSALGRCGGSPAAERMLRTALLDATCEVRAAAARALAACATAASFGELLGRLAQDDPFAAREAAEDEADALIEAIVALAEREGGEAADAAIALIETRLFGRGERARSAGARLLAALARPADAGRVRGLLADPSPQVRSEAVRALPRLADAGEELLRVALADEMPSVRSAAARVIPRLAHPAEAEANLEALAHDRDERVRSATMGALAERAAHSDARPAALALLARGVAGGGVVALSALDALQRLGGRDAAEIASWALGSAEPEIVERAAACVGAHGGEHAHALLSELLAHPAWPVRARAARELAARRTASAAPLLHARLGEERDEFVREALLAALAALES